MATKKAAKKEVTKTTRARVQVVKITPEQFLAAINRFAQVCEFVEHHMREQRQVLAPIDAAPYPQGGGQTTSPAPNPTVEDMAHCLRNLAQEVGAISEGVRHRLSSGTSNPGKSVSLEATNAPSQGPIKDSINAASDLLYAIRRDLYCIAEYVAVV